MVNDAPEDALSERAQQLLRALIENYIRDGQPVGSRVLSRDSGLQLSSATIRNVMADLEEWGFVTSPHTSAGRVPTDKGYRFFVDTLLQVKPLDGAAVTEIRRQLDGDARQQEVARRRRLAAALECHASGRRRDAAAHARSPRRHKSSSSPLSENRVLVDPGVR